MTALNPRFAATNKHPVISTNVQNPETYRVKFLPFLWVSPFDLRGVEKNELAAKCFGLIIKKYRETRGLSKQKLAYESGLDVRTIKTLEKGESGAGLHTLFSLAAALQVPAHQLILDTEKLMER